MTDTINEANVSQGVHDTPRAPLLAGRVSPKSQERLIKQAAAIFPAVSLFMEDGTTGGLVAWDGTPGTLAGITSFEVDATAGDRMTRLWVDGEFFFEGLLEAATLPTAANTLDLMRAAVGGTNFVIQTETHGADYQ